MILAVTATPLAMAHHQHNLGDASFVIQLHVLGMFLPRRCRPGRCTKASAGRR
jgi:hypothetical protein